MITLKTLYKATTQEVFDQVANHLLKQKAKARKSSGCHYRLKIGKKTLKCAAGALIHPTQYKKSFEGNDWSSLIEDKKVPDHHSDLIQRLQIVHDQWEVEVWVRELAEIADDFNLNFKF